MNFLIGRHSYGFFGFFVLFNSKSLISQGMVILALAILYDDYTF